ncbi:MAG: hypothetical protein ACXIT9_08910 [Nitritalea sp.]
MSESNNFYKKIGEKLSSHEEPFTHEAWLNFQPQLKEKLLPWYRSWYMPYLYSSLLAMLLFAHFQLSRCSEPGGGIATAPVVSITRLDTLYLVDTIYMKKTIVVQEEIQQLLTKENRHTTLSEAFPTAPSEAFSLVPMEKDAPDGTAPNLAASIDIEKEKGGLAAKNIQNPSAARESRGESFLPLTTPNAHEAGRDWKAVFEQEKDTLGAEAKTMQDDPPATKTRPLVILEMGLGAQLPIHPFVEYPVVGLQQVHIGLEWASGWSLFTGFYHGRYKGEIDDDDFDLLNTRQLAQLPSSTRPLTDIDEIYTEQNQLFFPLELRWRSAPVDAFSFETGFGLIGSYIRNQRIRYEFEDRLGLPDSEVRLPVRDFSVSHLKVSVGTQALLSEKLSIYLRSSYWQPLTGTGLLDLRVRGIDVAVGVQVAF